MNKSIKINDHIKNRMTNQNKIYNVGDCIEFKRFIPSTSPDVFEYIVSNGKILNNSDPELLEVLKIFSED